MFKFRKAEHELITKLYVCSFAKQLTDRLLSHAFPISHHTPSQPATPQGRVSLSWQGDAN
ncbi:hypothetical protein E2C01_041017 [Portunus trituberculatus]|uniref:Uncharacterized protein n=1 Tax=Portunus trituberculatus TaxID=210409 RepID=A0A5B7FP61_PORTR|nr:hypothetical protein [Portunus trituberculatus]